MKRYMVAIEADLEPCEDGEREECRVSYSGSVIDTDLTSTLGMRIGQCLNQISTGITARDQDALFSSLLCELQEHGFAKSELERLLKGKRT